MQTSIGGLASWLLIAEIAVGERISGSELSTFPVDISPDGTDIGEIHSDPFDSGAGLIVSIRQPNLNRT